VPELEARLWGAILHLDRSEGCFAATGVPAAGDLLLLTIPWPYGPAALAAVKLHKAWIGSRLGSEGVDLHFNWGGFMHWVETRGFVQPCDEGVEPTAQP
jgi:hypothetical protein